MMTDHRGPARTVPFAAYLGIQRKAKPTKTPKALPPAPKPKAAAPNPKIRASNFSHLFVNPPPAEAPHATSTPAARPSAPGAAQTSPKLHAAAERDLAARIIAAGRKRRGEAS